VSRYFCGTKGYAILLYEGELGVDNEVYVHGFVDFNTTEDLDQKRSSNGYVFKMFDGEINLMSKRKQIVSLSTTEVEYMVNTQGRK
jgi:hypothetical protein